MDYVYYSVVFGIVGHGCHHLDIGILCGSTELCAQYLQY